MRSPMCRHVIAAGSLPAVALALSTVALSDEPKSAAVTPRQMAHCVIQRIHENRRGDRTESYKEVFRACKQDLEAEVDHGPQTAMNRGTETKTPK